MKRRRLSGAAVAVGGALLTVGVCLLILIKEPQGVLLALPYVCIGVGCGVFGSGMGEILGRRAIRNNPEIQRQIQIEKNDERNQAISHRAKARAFDIMIYVFSILMLIYALIGSGLAEVLLLVGAYLLVIGCAVFFRFRYEKEM